MTAFTVPDMNCAHCEAVIEKAVTLADPNADVIVDLARRQVDVTSRLSDEQIISVLETEGYAARVIGAAPT